MRKGNQRIIWVVAMMVLAILFIALWYTSMETWVNDVGDQFLNNLL